MSTEVVRLFPRSRRFVSQMVGLMNKCNCSTTPERMDLVREEYIRQRQVARDAAAFQDAAPRAADGS